MGQAPGDQQLEQLLAVSAGKVLRGVAWTANPSRRGIEDRFLFHSSRELFHVCNRRLKRERDENFWKLVPEGFQSLTIYRNKAPATAWSSLDSAVAFKLDALPAVLFGSLLRSSLVCLRNQQIRKKCLPTLLSPPLLTLKPFAERGRIDPRGACQ
jgi:hypothetical protein